MEDEHEVRFRQRIAEAAKMANEIVLCSDLYMGRLVGIHEDAADGYYRLRKMRGAEELHTMVGWCVSLKGVYPRYEHLEALFTMNGCPPVDDFMLTVADDAENLATYGESFRQWRDENPAARVNAPPEPKG